MPISPPPIIYTCPSCHWSKTVAPKSDALMLGDFFDACPKCGNTALEARQVSAIDSLAQKIKGLLG